MDSGACSSLIVQSEKRRYVAKNSLYDGVRKKIETGAVATEAAVETWSIYAT